MSGLEVNKILASIILAILVVTVIGHLGDIIIDVEGDKIYTDPEYVDKLAFILKTKNVDFKYLNSDMEIFEELNEEDSNWEIKSARTFARKKNLQKDNNDEKNLSKMARAGFSYDICKKIIDLDKDIQSYTLEGKEEEDYNQIEDEEESKLQINSKNIFEKLVIKLKEKKNKK